MITTKILLTLASIIGSLFGCCLMLIAWNTSVGNGPINKTNEKGDRIYEIKPSLVATWVMIAFVLLYLIWQIWIPWNKKETSNQSEFIGISTNKGMISIRFKFEGHRQDWVYYESNGALQSVRSLNFYEP